ncbi:MULTISPECIES: DUF1254 domain-containing protein [Bradyrhizobium]|uniref:DUF1254 domain-containing protein n=1 Tax=Bradyrhizobium TaxID=374 RepID=UPI00155E5627|nr:MULTISPECIES: DUF1254 domain-containing protein [Bradyrhizobium]MDD1519226.1 hypothetical protein [Bradyrhizobium sp. WBAH30]MDD1543470.1 hypothetical protein [Bradyrhizobium sp. WBAH41]MDD1557600.1 hypothetical protein [Bradyrhizobium sp. WBAH23]MDD1565013.1 hypothetical protein [Bradyrhizobium sp. WBAH33]MDD1590420.1 hypothetical protein [Bradyrhizobium sp. WBAH42]
MSFTRRNVMLAGISLLAGTSMSESSRAELGELLGIGEGLEEFALATDAYIYGYPLVTMEMTRRVITNVAAPAGTRAPMGHIIKLRQYPDASFRDVTAPNADTLYTSAFFDVGKEPWVLSLPDMKGRYALFPMLDGWTTVFQVPGKRTTGTAAQTYAITGPGWKGTLPAGVKEYKSPTRIVWLLGRIYCTGTPEDYAEVHKLQDEVKLVPLSSYGKPYTPPPGTVDPSQDMKTAVREQVNRMDAIAYFTLLCKLMKDNPPAAADAPQIAKFARIGIVPGQDFDPSKLKADFVKRVPEIGFDRIMLQFKINKDMKDENGWGYTTKTGIYGTDYLMRALVTAIGLGANRPQDAVYPTSLKDAEGRKYNGANKYVIRFPKGQLPPAQGFWSLTMYDADYFFVKNPINRYSISARQNLKSNPDGSTDLYIQKDSPGQDKESNWLPAPAGDFVLMMRLYWPSEKKPSILDGSWKIPPVKKAVSV